VVVDVNEFPGIDGDDGNDYEFGQPLVINGGIVNEFNFPTFISLYYDA